MLRKFSSHITRRSYPQKVADAAKKMVLDSFKEKNPEISEFIDRNSQIEHIESPQLRSQQYSKLVSDINNNDDIILTGKTYTALGMADYLYKTVAISQEMAMLKKNPEIAKNSSLQSSEQTPPDTVSNNLNKFKNSAVNINMQIQARNIADLILEKKTDAKTLKEKVEDYSNIPGKSLSPDTKHKNYSTDIYGTYSYDTANSNGPKYSEMDEHLVPKPHQIKTYVFSHLLKSLSQTSNNTEENKNILFAAIRRTIDSKNETIGEFQQILSQTSDELSDSIVTRIKKNKEKTPDLFAPIKTVNDAIKRVDDISDYYQLQAKGALLGLQGSQSSLYEDTTTSFDNLTKTRKRMESRIEIEKRRTESNNETNNIINTDSAISTATIDFYKKMAAGNITTSKFDYNIMKFVSSVAELPDSLLPANRKICKEEELLKMPDSLPETKIKSR